MPCLLVLALSLGGGNRKILRIACISSTVKSAKHTRHHVPITAESATVPLGCIHAAFIFVMTMYTQLYNRLSFGWNTVKIDMSAARRDPLPIVPFGLAAFAATLFALGLALGTTIAVGMLFFIQIKIILRNKTSIESWIEEKAKDRIQYYQLDEVFIFPYDMGSKWKNFKQVFTWSGVPEGDGLEWPVREGCHQYSLTVEQLKQKADKRVRSVRYKVIQDYSGACCPLNRGVRTFLTSPCTEEPRIQLQRGELILATRGLRYWLYGDKILDDSFIEGTSRIRGWFPRNCVEKCPCDGESEPAPEGEKKTR
ncbi:palmitoyltransferase ZDHHC6 isoform X3 [Psammomys obesus]|uniref:palmitoyltransferase ZDHHC6 isoform X3 n=1 Tax=Psammomys obesus TaxID=48139 RepID=UPI002452C92D|nr:palmitoyltransferase ZDHHC6 isoform X3 [Psammomys obesus]